MFQVCVSGVGVFQVMCVSGVGVFQVMCVSGVVCFRCCVFQVMV